MRFYKKLSVAQTSTEQYLMSFDVMKGNKVVKEYVAYDSIDEYDGRDHMYEIIRGRQRLYFDIDSPGISLDDEVKQFIDHCKEEYETRVVCYTSHREDKFSYHIILQDAYARDNVQCKYYCKKLLQGTRLEPYADMNVYREMQHFRLMGCSKLGINNKKIVWIGQIEGLEDSLVTYYNGGTILDYADLDYVNMGKKSHELKNKIKKKINISSLK